VRRPSLLVSTAAPAALLDEEQRLELSAVLALRDKFQQPLR